MRTTLAILYLLWSVPPIFGPVLLIIAGVMQHKLNRREFERRNQMGVEIFESYGTMKKINFAEGWIGFLGGLVALEGILLTGRLGWQLFVG